MRIAADMASGPRLSVRKNIAASNCSGPAGESPSMTMLTAREPKISKGIASGNTSSDSSTLPAARRP